MSDLEVLVVGAGPTGLLAALLLARSGVDVRIVERRAEPTRESRAFAVQARTLELMRSLGLADEFVSRGVRADGVRIHVHGRFRGGLDFTRAGADDTPFPFILMIPQSRTEEILIEACRSAGVTVERGMEVRSVEQTSGGCTARMADGSSIESSYVLGADGSRSVVRSSGRFGWHGDMLPQRFLLADCRVDWELDHGQFRVFMNGPLVGLFLPLDGERRSRVMATDVTGYGEVSDGTAPEPLDLAEMERGLRAATSLPLTLADPVWVTRYRAHHRFVDRYADGRLFVAGDAAHIHSPAGGQGMNTGLQDAADLAWRLAAVAKHGADPALLDGYDAERRPIGERVVRSTGRLFAAAAGQAGWKAALRDRAASAVLPILSKVAPFQRKAFLNTSQRGVSYGRSRWVLGDAGPVGPGDRVPDADLGSGERVHARLSGYRPYVLIVEGSSVPAKTRKLFGATVDGAVTLAIRPDGYVAWRANTADPAGAAAFLATQGLFV